MFYDLFYAGQNVACPLKSVARRARTRWSLNRYLELIVDPTIEDFQRNIGSSPSRSSGFS